MGEGPEVVSGAFAFLSFFLKIFFFFLMWTIFFKKYYLYGCSGSSWLHWLFSSCGERAEALKWLLLLWNTGSRASEVAAPRLLEHKFSSCGSRLSCSAACGIFPDQREH